MPNRDETPERRGSAVEPQKDLLRADVRAATEVAVRWAEYAKTVGMYPETSVRVANCLKALMAAIEAFGRGDNVAVRLNAEEVRVGRTRFPLADAKLAWLEERLHKSALDGVAFGPGYEASIAAFSLKLLENYARKGKEQNPDMLWPKIYPGIHLLHRRFEGGFLGGGGTGFGPYIGPTVGVGEDGSGGGGPDDDVPDLVSQLAVEGPLQSAVGRIRNRLVEAGLFRDSETLSETDFRVDLLGKVVAALPAGAAGYEEIVGSSVGLLNCLDDHLAGQVALGNAPEDTSSESLRGLVFLASRMFFRPRTSKPVERSEKEETEAPRARGRAGDELVTADLDALLEEIRALPECEPGLLAIDPEELAAEQLDVYLHYLTTRKIDQPTDNLFATLRELLQVTDAEQTRTVKACLERAWFGTDGRGRQRILEFADAERMPRLLRQFGILSFRGVLEAFPDQFVLFVDALDFTRTDDREELRELLGLIGAQRMLAHGSKLATREGGLLERDRARRLLTFNAAEVLALAPALLETENAEIRSLVLSRIKSTRLDLPEALLLNVTSDPKHVTFAYLSSLIRAWISGTMPLPLGDHVAASLAEVIEQAGKTEGLTSPRRLEAIRALGAISAPRARMLLVTMLRRRRWLFFRAEPRPVRETVRAALSGAYSAAFSKETS